MRVVHPNQGLGRFRLRYLRQDRWLERRREERQIARDLVRLGALVQQALHQDQWLEHRLLPFLPI